MDCVKNDERVWVLSEIRKTVRNFLFSDEDLLLANNCSLFVSRSRSEDWTKQFFF